MLFSSPIFLFAFLPLTLAGYYLLDRKFRNVFLLIMSLIFYAWGEPKFIFVMLLSTLVNWLFGLAADKFRENKKAAYAVIALMVLWNISVFFVYKYLDFAIGNVNALFKTDIPLRHIALPIGISFFTFQAMSYVIDVYRGNGKVQKNPLNVALYITFFPQLIAGPIVRYETVANEINCRRESFDSFSKGVKRFIIGLGKKIILSNSIAVVADAAFNMESYSNLSVSMAWLGALAYALQIYFDFGGYSDMAIGLGLMFGFHFNENFDYPYITQSVSEFWRRWHISLGTWFRDYVYFPLGGSRVKSKARLILNLFAVWFLTGVWHGASWNFILWGLLFFVFITFEKLSGYPKKFTKPAAKTAYRILTLVIILWGWVLFRAEDLPRAWEYIKCMIGLNGNPLSDSMAGFILGDSAVIYLLGILFSIPVIPFIAKKAENTKLKAPLQLLGTLCLLGIFAVSIAFSVTGSYDPFIYFNF